MPQIIDNAIALRIIYLLTKPFKEWDAYKEGIIDEDGKIIDSKDSPNWTMLHRLVCRIKVLIGKLPGGKTTMASLIAAYMLVREERELTDNELLEELQKPISFKYYKELEDLFEDAPAMGVAAVAGLTPDSEPPMKKKKKVMKRKELEDATNIN